MDLAEHSVLENGVVTSELHKDMPQQGTLQIFTTETPGVECDWENLLGSSEAYTLGANGYLDKLSDGMPWFELVRSVARYWLGINITPNSFAAQEDGQARLLK